MSDCSDNEAATDKQLKVVIVGDGASGKVSTDLSSIVLRLKHYSLSQLQFLICLHLNRCFIEFCDWP